MQMGCDKIKFYADFLRLTIFTVQNGSGAACISSFIQSYLPAHPLMCTSSSSFELFLFPKSWWMLSWVWVNWGSLAWAGSSTGLIRDAPLIQDTVVQPGSGIQSRVTAALSWQRQEGGPWLQSWQSGKTLREESFPKNTPEANDVSCILTFRMLF